MDFGTRPSLGHLRSCRTLGSVFVTVVTREIPYAVYAMRGYWRCDNAELPNSSCRDLIQKLSRLFEVCREKETSNGIAPAMSTCPIRQTTEYPGESGEKWGSELSVLM